VPADRSVSERPVCAPTGGPRVEYGDCTRERTTTVPSPAPARRIPLLGLGAALLLGAAVRLGYVLAAAFPLHDGGLFYVMTRDLQRNGYALPATTTYNAAALPFAYPPLGFYVAGLAATLMPWSLLAVFRGWPLLCCLLLIPAFFALASRLLGPRAAACAVVAFALLPRSFEWLLMGGGVTRAPGLLFAVLALWQAHRLYAEVGQAQTTQSTPGEAALPQTDDATGARRPAAPDSAAARRPVATHFAAARLLVGAGLVPARGRRGRSSGAAPLALTTLFAAATVLSHPEIAWFLAYSAALFWLAWGRTRHGTAASVLVALGVALLTAPWWATVLARHGPGPLLAAGSSGWTLLGLASLLKLTISDEPAFPLLGALALVGALVCLRERRWLLPVWLATVFLLGPRSALTIGSVPLGLLAGVGMAQGLVPLALGAGRDRALGAERGRSASPGGGCAPAAATTEPRPPAAAGPKAVRSAALCAADRRWRPLLLGGAVVFLLTYATAGAALGLTGPLGALGADERAAMAWIAQGTPPTSRFAVVTGDRWAGDRSSEWFPALTDRVSVATVQGYEWLGGGAFRAQTTRYDALQACARQTADCLEAWRAASGTPFSHVYVAKRPVVQFVPGAADDDCCAVLRASLAADPRYQRVYDGPGAAVFVRGD